jgi:uncharacterized protein YyaL (SSP411 family)
MSRPENRLGLETSPYLRQHRFDPVDWYPFGDEAFERARALDRPLFLSIGYSACHWCHVMAHESFADEATAALMNEIVVAVKVDREERPDVDAVYMEAVIAASGHGGWPMSVFALPDGRPFFAGTYFPTRPHGSMPSFRQVLGAVDDVWRNRRADVEEQAGALSEAVGNRLRPMTLLAEATSPGTGSGGLTRESVLSGISAACGRLSEIADPTNGGFGHAPKFPQPLYLELLLRAHVDGVAPEASRPPLEIALDALEAMASGGIYDHLGGGFSRYSVDDRWIVPHFEKMLYDQAQLGRVYLHAWQVTGDERWLQVHDETAAYVLSRLRHPSGALCSAEDADSEGEEGRFYLWSPSELESVLGGELAAAAAAWYGVSGEGNFEGRSILLRPVRGELVRPPGIDRARRLLEAARDERVRPGLDDKVIVEWNAMAVVWLAEAAAATGDLMVAEAAGEILDVLLDAVERANGITPRLAPPSGEAVRLTAGYAADVAWLAEACTSMFELTGEPRYVAEACRRADELLAEFVDPATGLVWTTRHSSTGLIVRPSESSDGVTPSAASVGAGLLARLGALTGEERYLEAAERIVGGLAAMLSSAPLALPGLLAAADRLTGGIEVVGVGSGRELLRKLRRRYVPNALWLLGPTVASDRPPDGVGAIPAALLLAGPSPLLAGRDGSDAVFVCRQGACRLPATTLAEAERELDAALRELSAGAP